MSQSVTSSFSAQNAASAKGLDYAFVIAGWPTVYTVTKATYGLVGDFVNFTALKAWADLPVGAGAAVKRRPEEGQLTIGQVDISVLDRVSGGVRALTDLLAREAYLEGTSPGVSTSLTAQLDNSATTVTVGSTSGFPSAGTIHIGLECIKYAGITSTTFTGCTRGYLLTSPTPHANGMSVYSFMPSVYRRKAYLYKGFQNLGLDQWARAFGGTIAGARKSATVVTFSLMSSTWDTYLDGRRVVFGSSKVPTDPSIFGAVSVVNDVLAGDYSLSVNASFPTTNLTNGHYLLNVGGSWKAITG